MTLTSAQKSTAQLEALIFEFEKEHNVEVLLAVVAGSRAWGLSSPFSDYDVKVIYREQPEKAFALFPEGEHITVDKTIDDGSVDVEISGWSVQKALKIAAASNPQICEFIRCPEKIRCDTKFLQDLKDLAHAASPRVIAHYYRGFAKKSLLGSVVKETATDVKTCLQVVRGLMSSRWMIENHQAGGFPPLAMSDLRASIDLSKARHALPGLNGEIDRLIEIKTTLEERKSDISIPCLHYWMLGEVEALDKDVMTIPEQLFDKPLVEAVFRRQYPETFGHAAIERREELSAEIG